MVVKWLDGWMIGCLMGFPMKANHSSIQPSTHPSLYPTIHLIIHSSIQPFIQSSIHTTIKSSIHFIIHLFFKYPSIHPSSQPSSDSTVSPSDIQSSVHPTTWQLSTTHWTIHLSTQLLNTLGSLSYSSFVLLVCLGCELYKGMGCSFSFIFISLMSGSIYNTADTQ